MRLPLIFLSLGLAAPLIAKELRPPVSRLRKKSLRVLTAALELLKKP